MTSERTEDLEPQLAGLPLFSQPLPATSNHVDRQSGTVAHLQPASNPIGSAVDWSLAAALRANASEQLSQAVAADRGRLDKAAQKELGLSLIHI